MKIFEKVSDETGTRYIYFLGKKVFSYQREKYRKLTERRARAILEKKFKKSLGYKLNINNPQTINEKIQWLKLYYRNPLLTKCADKVRVREYVSEVLGEDYLIPIIGIYDSPDDIDFDSLPDKFALKVNWGSGQNIICSDKSKLDVEANKKLLVKWMKPYSNQYFHTLEWAYKDIVPRILIEKFIESEDERTDYKFFCFNGIPKCMCISKNRLLGSDKLTVTYFDMQFNQLPFNWGIAKASPLPINRPQLWDKLIETATKLAQPFPFVRVDLYVINNQIKVGELTFYHSSGMQSLSPEEWDLKLGKILSLPKRTPLENG